METRDNVQPRLNSIALEHAVLCADCEIISDSAGEVCEACGSRSLLSLGRVLGGGLGAVRARLIDTSPERLQNAFTLLLNAESSLPLHRRRKRRLS
ncbi:MAG TPA: hypothetical protein VFB04_01545 [Terriglobales bacterium]|nr:hypothetical protein [Terriglobales bacterium]